MNKEQIIEEYRKQLAHERYIKYKGATMKWRENNRERYNQYMKEYSKNYLLKKAQKQYQKQYEQ